MSLVALQTLSLPDLPAALESAKFLLSNELANVHGHLWIK